MWRAHVGQHGLHGLLLIRCLVERELFAESLVLDFVDGVGDALAGLAPGIDRQQFGGHVAHLLGGLALGLLPGIRAQAMQRCGVGIGARVAHDQMQRCHRHVQLGAVGIFQRQELGLGIVDVQRLQAQIAAHAVVDMDHRRADAELGEVLDDKVGIDLASPLAAGGTRALAVQVRLGDHRDAGFGVVQRRFQRRHHQAELDVAGQELVPGAHRLELDAGALQQGVEQVLAAGALGAEQHPRLGLQHEGFQCAGGYPGVGVDADIGQPCTGKAVRSRAAAIVLCQDLHPWKALERREHLVHTQEQAVRGHQRPLDVVAQRLVTRLHIGAKARGLGLHIAHGEEPRGLRQVVEQRRQTLEEQRQVVLDARRGQAALDVLVDRAAALVDIETRMPGITKATDAGRVQRGLATRQYRDRLYPVDRTLGLGIEGAQRLDLVVEQVDPERHALPHRKQVDDGATYGELAVLADGLDRSIAGLGERPAATGQVEALTDRQFQRPAADVAGGHQAVEQGRDRYHQHPAAGQWQACQRRQALGDDLLMRRKTVIGQRFPVRERQYRQGIVEEERKLALDAPGGSCVRHQYAGKSAASVQRLGYGQALRAAMQVEPAQPLAWRVRQRRGEQGVRHARILHVRLVLPYCKGTGRRLPGCVSPS